MSRKTGRDKKRRAPAREDRTQGPSSTLRLEQVAELRGLPFEVNFLCFSLDGSLLAAATEEGPVQLWHVEQRRLLQSHPLQDDHRLVDLTFADDNILLAASCYERKDIVRIWRSDTGEKTELRGDSSKATGAAFLPGGQHLVTTDLEWRVCLWDLSHRQVVASRTWQGGRRLLGSLSLRWDYLAVSPDGRYLALCCDVKGKQMQLWQVDTSTPRFDLLQVLPDLSHLLYMCLSPGGQLLVLWVESPSPLARIDLYSVPEMKLIEQVRVPPGADPLQDGILNVAFSPDERYLALSGDENKVWIWSRPEQRFVASFEAATRVLDDDQWWSVREVAWSPDGRLLATGGYSPAGNYWEDFTVRLWKVKGLKLRTRN